MTVSAGEGRESGNAFDDVSHYATLQSDSTPHASPGNGEADQAGSFPFSGKPALTLDEQVAHLRAKGLSVPDGERAVACLACVNYYRLRGYWLTLEESGRFKRGVSFQDVWDVANIDSDVRQWVAAAIEPVEIKLRAQFAQQLAVRHGANALRQAGLFKSEERYRGSMAGLDREIRRALRDRNPFVAHHMEKDGMLPIWATVEVASLGTISKLYGNLKDAEASRAIAASFGIKPYYLKGWVEHLTYVRNICAHHNRFYNRLVTKRPVLYRDDRRYAGAKEFPTFLVLRQLHMRSWPSEWPDRLAQLCAVFDRRPSVDVAPMGFPKNWREAMGASLAVSAIVEDEELA